MRVGLRSKRCRQMYKRIDFIDDKSVSTDPSIHRQTISISKSGKNLKIRFEIWREKFGRGKNKKKTFR